MGGIGPDESAIQRFPFLKDGEKWSIDQMRLEVTMNKLASWMGWRALRTGGGIPGGLVFPHRTKDTQWSLAACLMLLVVVCAHPLQAARDENKVLQEQATKLWDARVKGDWATVYDYLSEEEREDRTREKYVEVSKQAGPWRYLNYKIGAVEVAKDMGWVKVEYSAEPVQFPGIKPRQRDRWEKWEKVDDRWTVVPGKRAVEFPKLPPSQRPINEEKAVQARAEQFWRAQEKSDFTAIYYLCAPDFRKKVSLEQWLLMKSQRLYLSHEILWVEVTGDHAVVRTAYEYRLNDPAVSKMAPVEDVAAHDWLKVDGQWYLSIND